ncbi:glycosyltransferase family 9 protein [candidate division KSB1 bacterium]|nr:glycosyltransferase family 9 protein [candidate division KSB1 bacterium]
MIRWRRIEQFFKYNLIRFLEKWLGKSEIHLSQFKSNGIKRILIVRQHDQLGDFLLSTPVFRALRSKFPNAFIAVVARNYTASLALHNQYINKVIPFYEHGRDWNLKRIFGFIKQLTDKYDLAVVLNTVSHSLTSDLIARFSGASYILGSEHLPFHGALRNFFYNMNAPYLPGINHQSERNLDIVRYIGADTNDLSEHITLLTSEKEWALNFLKTKGWDETKKIISVHPGAGKKGNRWPVENFAAAVNRLSKENNAQLLLTWGPGEENLGKQLEEFISGSFISVTHPEIRKVAALLSCSSLFLCNDTGVMHLAAAAGVPLVVVFGPTNPEEWKPIGEQFVAVRGINHECYEIKPNKVIKIAQKLLL